MAYTKQMGQENKAMFEAAQAEIDRIGYIPDSGANIAAKLQPRFPDIAPARLRHQVARALARRRGEKWRNSPGAPAGNTNATRKDGQPRQALNVRVEQSTLDWLQAQADREADGNIGRWLDRLAFRYT